MHYDTINKLVSHKLTQINDDVSNIIRVMIIKYLYFKLYIYTFFYFNEFRDLKIYLVFIYTIHVTHIKARLHLEILVLDS